MVDYGEGLQNRPYSDMFLLFRPIPTVTSMGEKTWVCMLVY